MPKAIWNGIVIAESADTVVVEGNHYFPRSSLLEEVIRPSAQRTFCPWKGYASYYTLEHDEVRSEDAVWFYADPKPKAEMVRDRVAFWKDVRVVD
jgi:uncharacterized protein (DUF427 family)